MLVTGREGLDSRLTDGAKVVRFTRRPRLIPLPKEDFRYSILLEAESIPDPQCAWKHYVNWKENLMTSSGLQPTTFRLVTTVHSSEEPK
jgi:hypothetical protein